MTTQALTADGQPIGWTITDPDGNVVASGPVSVAEITADLAQALGLDTPEGA